MGRWLTSLPLLVLTMGIGALAMLPVSIYAYFDRDYGTGRTFLYAGLLFLMLFAMIGIATSNYTIRRQGRSYLISLLGTFTVLPVMLAVPFAEAMPSTSFFNAYFEMVSSLTTTGATLFRPERLPDSLHLWRGIVGWMGGFFVWVTAVAILAPMNLGGFEVGSGSEIGQGVVASRQITGVASSSKRLARFAGQLAPIYVGFTVFVWAGLLLFGERPLVAVMHAMASMATSGISPIGGLAESRSGIGGEILIFLALILALSRKCYSSWDRPEGWSDLVRDPELRLGLSIVMIVPLILFVLHWLTSWEETVSLPEGLLGLWGGAFTVLSFLTTTGFVSLGWDEAQAWSGLREPGLILMGLAVFGGGVATTAGGVKLFRVFVLYSHVSRELEKLILPSSIGLGGREGRNIRRYGAQSAWIFFMLFAMSIAAIMFAFAMTDLEFETLLVLSVSALSTTGPLTQFALSEPIALIELSTTAKSIYLAATVIGRLETLAIIALLNPAFWR